MFAQDRPPTLDLGDPISRPDQRIIGVDVHHEGMRREGVLPERHPRQYTDRRRTAAEKLRFYNIAQASADETLYHLILAHDLGYANTQELQAADEEVSRMLQGYINGLERNHG